MSHTIVFAHDPLFMAEVEFNEAFIRAALLKLHVEFVGPAGSQTRLERAALHMPALRLDPVRVYNGLVRLALVGQRRPPSFDTIAAALNAHDYVKEIVAEARASQVTEVGLDEAAENRSGDVAGVRGVH